MGRGRGEEAMRSALLVAVCLLLAGCGQRTLTICADPNNLPFSNKAGEGFENRIATALASQLHAKLRYIWWAQRRGYVRNTVSAHKCDLWMGVASGLDRLATSRPYYRASYVFVSRRDRHLAGLSLDDPRLRSLKIGVQMVGDDGVNTPPAHALSRRGIIANVRGYMLYGDYSRPNPPARIVSAVADGDIDVGLVWGPLANWSAKQSNVPLQIDPVTPWLDDSQWPMVYDISIGVAKDDPALLRDVDRALVALHGRIDAILKDYGIDSSGGIGSNVDDGIS